MTVERIFEHGDLIRHRLSNRVFIVYEESAGFCEYSCLPYNKKEDLTTRTYHGSDFRFIRNVIGEPLYKWLETQVISINPFIQPIKFKYQNPIKTPDDYSFVWREFQEIIN